MKTVPRSVARADLILADSDNTRQDVIELLGVSEDRVRIVLAGLELTFRPVTDPSIVAGTAKLYGIERPYILSVGTLQPRKNLVRLIKAFALLREQHHVPHQLLLAGRRGWLYEPIFDMVKQLSLGEHVLLPGYVAEADLPALYTGADLFAFPSLYEGFGIPVLEAMGCETPVLSANTSSIPEVAGDAALLVDPTNTEAIAAGLWRLIDDAALRTDLRHKGKQRVTYFTWERAAHQLLETYKYCMNEVPGEHEPG